MFILSHCGPQESLTVSAEHPKEPTAHPTCRTCEHAFLTRSKHKIPRLLNAPGTCLAEPRIIVPISIDVMIVRSRIWPDTNATGCAFYSAVEK